MKKQIVIYAAFFIAFANSCRDTQQLNNQFAEEEKGVELLSMDSTAVEFLVPNENFYHTVYHNRGVKQCITTLSEFENGKLIHKYNSGIDYLDSLGYTIYSEEFYSDNSPPSCIVRYEYDSLRRMIKEVWNWKDPDSFDKTVYKYENRLTEIIDYSKDSINSDYQIESRTKVHYKDGKIDLMLSENNDTISYFIHQDNLAYQYSKLHDLGAEYQNGLLTKSVFDNSILIIERDEKGNMLKLTSLDSNENIQYMMTYEYKNELLIKSTTLSADGAISFIYDYKYVY